MSDSQRIHAETAEGWEIVARHKYRSEMARRLERLRAGDTSVWDSDTQGKLSSLCSGQRVVHLQCSGGFEALSLLALGAVEVIGVDISPDMINQAQEASDELDASASWYCCDVLDTPSTLDGKADIVYTGGGALPWIMDLDSWAQVVFRLLSPGGSLYLDELHPLSYLWDVESQTYMLVDGVSYSSECTVVNRGYPATRVAMHTDDSQRPAMRERVWPLGDVINAVINVGLNVRSLREINDPGWNAFPNMDPNMVHRLPHRYVLEAEKTEAQESP